ncbi:MAG: hypothetical protein JO101_03340, partial [Candidatus Eremiobacteraeota bacterium]|nr:hypothetical protein [Candidatus Eremiobacteraeota bacterium]
MSNLINRARVRELIAANGGRRVRLVGAPAGYGKSTALREVASALGGQYLALRPHTTFAQFIHDLVHSLAAHAPGMQLTLAGAHARALQAVDPPATLAAWFLRHLPKQPCTIVLDDL